MRIKAFPQIAEENRLPQNVLDDMRVSATCVGICGILLGVASVWIALGVYKILNF